MITTSPIVRTLPAIVQDLALTKLRLACVEARPVDGDGWDRLRDRRDALQFELEDVFERQNGVTWALVSGVMS